MSILLSIVIPAYNEDQRIGQTLDDVLSFIGSQSFRSEVIVVNDGSGDHTAQIAIERMKSYKSSGAELRLVHNYRNRGKGYSVRRGVEEARGTIVLFSDADLSSPIAEAPKLLTPLITGQADLTLGSRALNRKLIGVRQPLARNWAGRIFNLLVKIITGLEFKDTQCGFKAFRRDCILPAFRLQLVEGFGFDPELLYIARKIGLRSLEVPVVWNHAEGSKVRFFQDSLTMLIDLMTVRVNDLFGRYRPAVARAKADHGTLALHSMLSRHRAAVGIPLEDKEQVVSQV